MSQINCFNNLYIIVIALTPVLPDGAAGAGVECAHRTEDLQH